MREKDVNLPCRIFAILVMLFLLAPLVVIVIASFTPTALITFPPQGFSLKWYANIFGSSTHFMDGLVNSLKIGILATAADILLGVTAALSVCRYSFKGKDALLNYYTSPMYVPSVAFAFVLLQVYSQIGGVPGYAAHFHRPSHYHSALHRAEHGVCTPCVQLDAGGCGYLHGSHPYSGVLQDHHSLGPARHHGRCAAGFFVFL